MNQDPERGNLPSASKLERIVACPGCLNMEKAIPEQNPQEIEDDSDEAKRGTRIHLARETGNTFDLNEEELDTYKRGLKFENDLLIAWREQFGIPPIRPEQEHKEERIWLFNGNLDAVASGRLDVFYLNLPDEALCIDWKSSYCTNLIPSPRSFQLRLQAVLLRQEYGVKRVRVAFDKPKVKWDNTDFTDYTEQDLQYAEQQIFYHLWEAEQEDAPRRAGNHCKFCPGRAYCPEAGAHAMLPSVIASRAMPITSKETAQQAVALLAPADLLKIWDLSKVVEWISDAVKARLKAMTPEELSNLGLMIGEGRKLDPIVNSRGAFDLLRGDLLRGANFTEDDLWVCLDMSKTAVADLVARELNLTKKDAAAWVDKNLNDAIERKRAEGSLKKIK